MHESHRSKRRLARRSAIKLPGNFFFEQASDGMRVIEREFGKDIVRMLVVDQWLAVISFAGLKEFGKSRVRRS